ncbi:Alba-like protein [Operophtera brumata]|uniref:Alba-like protein n=1 Tax=Operophtera brumata TaxID=104452 RepID=A0A0L7LD94_OPEBR|nr:Alba-like protein [Operophtera brumata]
MENYTKGKNVEEILERNSLPFKDLPQNFLWMQNKEDTVVVWTGAGVGIGKAITCAELTKREFKIQHQYWDPKLEGLEKIVVKRRIPVIHILLSLEKEFDTDQPGYQSLNGKKFWQAKVTDTEARSSQKGKGKGKKHHQYKGNRMDKGIPKKVN